MLYGCPYGARTSLYISFAGCSTVHRHDFIIRKTTHYNMKNTSLLYEKHLIIIRKTPDFIIGNAAGMGSGERFESCKITVEQQKKVVEPRGYEGLVPQALLKI